MTAMIRNDPMNDIVARRIIAAAHTGLRDPELALRDGDKRS
jgi:hypothetical protein